MYFGGSQSERENKVFVGMLPKSLDEQDLYDVFRSFGELKEVCILIYSSLKHDIHMLTFNRSISYVKMD